MVAKNIFYFRLAKTGLLSSIFLLSLAALGDVSPLCNDLARYSCAPGSYKDQTGTIKSSSEIQKFMSSYAEKSRSQLNEKFKKILADPENSYFKELAVAGLGLKNSPQCASSNPGDISTCRENLIDGLTMLVQRQTLSPLMPAESLYRMSGISDTGYILQNEVYKGIVKGLNNQAQSDLSNPEVEKKIKEKIFPSIKVLIVERLNQLTIPDEQKKFMINKIKSIQFAGTNCAEVGNKGAGSGSQTVASLLIPNAFYFQGSNTFRYCSGFLLQSTSEFDIARTIAHELSHSIDPCNLSIGPSDMGFKYKNSDDLHKMEQEFPLKNVISCLRDPRSVEAKNFDEKQRNSNQYGYGNYPPPNGSSYPTLPSTGGVGMVQGQLTQPKLSFCDRDQITESFADWMGAEVLPQYIEKNYKLTAEQYREGYANVFRVSCWVSPEISDYNNTDTHPTAEKRINRILLVNPKIRTQMGCPANHPETPYCNSEKPLNSPAEPTKISPQPGTADSIRGVR